MKSKMIKGFTLVIAMALMVLTFLASCDILGKDDHQHSYDRKDTSFTYLASEADCENSARYYYSCSCGKKGSETFTYGNVADHTYSAEWSYDEDAHWHATVCSHEGRADISAHDWNDGKVTKNPTEEADGEKVYKCVVCNVEKTEAIPAINHVHTYEDVWSSDGDVHWHAASCDHNVRADISVHIWNEGEVITAPTENKEGATLYRCVVCGEEKTRTVPVLGHTHSYSSEWSSDEYLHWRGASCGHDEKIDMATHILSGGVITTPATEESTGVLTRKCVICEHTVIEIIPKIEHVHKYEERWSYDDDTHWYATSCGHDVKADVSVHVWNSGTVITEATESEEGAMLYKCVICKKEKTAVIPTLEHEHTYNKEWSSDLYIHWHETTCIHDDKIDVAAHIWGESIVTTPATEDNTGVLTYTCVICRAEKTEEIPKLEHFHTYSNEWSYNSESHWRAATCQHTSEVTGESDHLWNNGVITTPPSDQATGIKTYTCVVCEHTKTEILPIVGHVHSFTVKNTNYLNSAADCTHKATYYYSCECGERGDALFEYGEVAAHRFVNYVSDGNATCSADGTKTAKCENCDKTNTISDIGSLTPHSYAEEWKSDESYHWHVATCEHSGVVSGMGSHNWNTGDVISAPTETAEGVMLYTCVDCARTKNVTLPVVTHTHSFSVKTDAYIASQATCQSKATYYYVCACGAVGSDTYEFGALGGHKFGDYVYDGNATCASDGTKTAVCSVDGCGESDTVRAEGTKLSHSFSSAWSSNNSHHWHAADCGHSNEISGKEEHQWDAGVIVKNSSETEEGEKRFTCVVCGKTKIEATPKLDHAHTFNVKTDKYIERAATCTSKARYFYTCVCGAVGEATYEYGSLANHSYDDYVSNNDATCASDGTKTRVCSACGNEDSKVEIGTKLPHTFSKNWTYDENQHWHAGICGHADERANVEDHTWDAGVILTSPTETSDGSRLHTCTVCDTTKIEVIPHLNHVHTFDDEWSYNAEKHWHAATCSHANEKSDEAVHSFVLDPDGSSGATVYEGGVQLYRCSVCGYENEVITSKLPAFTVIFYDSSYNVISEKNYAIGTGSVSVPTAPVKVGYSFFEWIDAKTEIAVDATVFANAADGDVYIFNPVYLKNHKVTFVDNRGNILGIITVLDGQYIDPADLPAIPDRVGYSSAWESSVTKNMVTEDMTVSPVYNALTYSVTFVDNDGKSLTYIDELGNTVSVQSVNYGSFAIVPDYSQYWFDKTTLKLYEFTGWSVDVEQITDNHIGANAIKALYEKEVDHPVVAIKISGKTAKISITLPDNAEIYSIKLSGKWSTANGLCGITLAQIESISSLNKDACGETLCTVGDKHGESGWITYNNKNYTFDFLWTCGNGHTLGAENVFTLTFESPSPSFVLDKSIFEILSSSSIIYGDSGADITELKKSDVFVWFYE